jgi:general secretion pathway protein I
LFAKVRRRDLRRRVSRRKKACSHDDGFTLLEVLVALGILAMSLTVLLGVFTMALDRTRSNESRTAAEHLAEALLLRAETTDVSALGDSHGTQSDLTWTIKTSPYGTSEDRSAWQSAPLRIVAEVQWQDHGRARTLSLSTLRIAPGAGHD